MRRRGIAFSNKVVYVFILLGVLVAIAVGINAYGGNQPSAMGHSFGELEGVQARIASGMTTCSAANKAIKLINPATGVVTCETDDVAGSLTVSMLYSVWNGATVSMNHRACFLTRVRKPMTGSFEFDCQITGSPGSWVLASYKGTGGEVMCQARCID